MQRKLKDITEIRSGYSFRETIPANEAGDYKVIQIKDVTYEGTISGDDLLRTHISSIKPAYLTKLDDVLFTARGANRRAGVIEENAVGAIFVSQLYALKIKSEISPEYLAWYLNQKPAREFFEGRASGSYIQNIRRDVLGELPITVPPIETQNKIVAMYRLSLRERRLAEEVTNKRQQIIENALLSMIEEN